MTMIMNSSFHILLFFIYLILGINSSPNNLLGDESLGVLLLDSWTFPVVFHDHPFHGIVLCMHKKDIQDYGANSIRMDFLQLAVDFQKLLDEQEAHKILFAQVLVNGAVNGQLGRSLGLTPTSKGVCAFIVYSIMIELIIIYMYFLFVARFLTYQSGVFGTTASDDRWSSRSSYFTSFSTQRSKLIFLFDL